MSTVYEVITNRIIQQLEAGTAPWHKPWRAHGKSGLPRNLATGREYRGVNVWVLLSSGFSSPYWLTYRQANILGGYVRQGEVGFPVVYWKFEQRETQDGDEISEKPSVLCRYYTVFNAEQCVGLRFQPPQTVEHGPNIQPMQACERIIDAWQEKPTISHGGDSASYDKALDHVRMPERDSFESVEEYYSTLFHELTHSTGHPNRLNRSTLTDFERWGDANYSKEELVAELGSAFLAGYCGIENRTIKNSAAYLANWLGVLRHDSRMIVIAGSQAQKATDLILGFSPTITK
ncbi:MAG TPA: zincin-like metallopeptidase domain-containing protein [Dongiaceae bacterium]|nr:zincin-like metallopeptidase domain-containing protein [Dongiaceae bacterium]